MALSNQQIIALLNIKGIGLQSVVKIGDHIHRLSITPNTEELFNMIEFTRDKNAISKKFEFNIDILEIALKEANTIIQKSEENNIGILSKYDNRFPELLKKTVDKKGTNSPPIIIYYKGDINTISLPSIAIIGTRTPTQEGIIASHYYGYTYANEGYNIISGLAKGCDTAAHRGALQSNTGKTCAVLAHGLDTIYPAENKTLADEILRKGGLLISEYPIGTILERHNLVARNRLQAGLALATIVIQTGISGGTLHAAHATLASKKPLFCIDYNNDELMETSQVKGNKILIEYHGAKALNSKNTKDLIRILSEQKENTHYIQGDLFGQ